MMVGMSSSPAAGRAVDLRLGAAVLLAALASPAMAFAGASELIVQDGWMRMLIPSRPAAGYFTLRNDGDAARTLVGASSPACGMLMLHRSVHQGGQDRMEMVKSVDVPAHGAVSFAPGGYHLMCTSPKASVRPGGSVPVTLRFADGATVEATFAVKGPNGK
jgi:copper(I)-binding protein